MTAIKAKIYKNIDDSIAAEGSMTVISSDLSDNYASATLYCKVNKCSSETSSSERRRAAWS